MKTKTISDPRVQQLKGELWRRHQSGGTVMTLEIPEVYSMLSELDRLRNAIRNLSVEVFAVDEVNEKEQPDDTD